MRWQSPCHERIAGFAIISVKGFTDEAAHRLHYGNNFLGAFYDRRLESAGPRGKVIRVGLRAES